MTMLSAFHNLSRSVGCALLALVSGRLVVYFVAGELVILLVYKIVRGDFYWWVRLGPVTSLVGAFIARTIVLVIVAFSGCIHYRHPYEMTGLGYSINMIWAQIMPFVALQFYQGDKKDLITSFLVGSFCFWLFLNLLFFCTIDLKYFSTFFSTMTGPQYTCLLYNTSKEYSAKFDAVFSNRIAYTKSIHGEVKVWVAENIDRWKREKPDFFNIELIPDELLPVEVLRAEGGAKRRGSSVSIRELVGGRAIENERRVHPA